MMLEYTRVRKGAHPPERANPSDAGLDLFFNPENGQDITVEPEHYLGVYRIIAVSEHLPAGARTKGQPFCVVHYLVGIIEGEQISPV